MGTDYIKYYIDLQQELADAKVTLETLNDSIRRQRFTPRSDKSKLAEGKQQDGVDRQSGTGISGSKRRNDTKSVFNRLSAPVSRSSDEEFIRPRLTSRVIRELPSRQEIVEAQGVDSESRARNRRMFGSLLGTLHKFCQEESRLKHKEDKKAQIEKKLEEQAVQERESLKRERESLFLDRRRKQVEIRRLELKMHRMKDFEVWESSMKTLMKHQIRTKASPHIYYKPKVMSKRTEAALVASQTVAGQILDTRRAALNLDLQQIEIDVKVNEMTNDDRSQFFNIRNTIQNDKLYDGRMVDSVQQGVVGKDQTDCSSHKEEQKSSHTRDDPDSKENKLRNNEPLLHSSVVVVRPSNNRCSNLE